MQSLDEYRAVHAQHPDNLECLRYLLHLCTELGHRQELEDYAKKLRQAEKLAAAHQSVAQQPVYDQQVCSTWHPCRESKRTLNSCCCNRAYSTAGVLGF